MEIIMGFKTKTVWDRECTAEEVAALEAKILELKAEGVTDGVKHYIRPDDVVATRRFWTTQEAADGWLAFQMTFDPPPTRVFSAEEVPPQVGEV